MNTGRKGELRSVAGFVHEVTLSVSVRVKCLLTQFFFFPSLHVIIQVRSLATAEEHFCTFFRKGHVIT